MRTRALLRLPSEKSEADQTNHDDDADHDDCWSIHVCVPSGEFLAELFLNRLSDDRPSVDPPADSRDRNDGDESHHERDRDLAATYRSGGDTHRDVAGHAVTLGRLFGAVPSPVTSTASTGCNRLIRNFGAVLETDADGVAEFQ